MQCKYCNKQSYITHICPYCKEYYCLDHREPKAHNCPPYQQLYQTPTTPQPQKFQQPATKMLKRPQTPSVSITNIHKNFFAVTFALVLFEEILRQISYIKNPPFQDGNFYVRILYQWITPYIASVIIFLITCLILFATKKLASKNQDANNPYINLLKKAIALGIYTTIATIYIFSLREWFLILLT